MTELLAVAAQYQGLIYFVGNLFLGWIIWSADHRFVKKEEFTKLRDRVQAIELRIEAMPSAAAIMKLSEQLVRVEGALQTMNARYDGMQDLSDRLQNQVDRMEEYLSRRTG